MTRYLILLSYFFSTLFNISFSIPSISFQPNPGISSFTVGNDNSSRSSAQGKKQTGTADRLRRSSDSPTDQLIQRSFFMNDMIESLQGTETKNHNHPNLNDHPSFVLVKIWNMVNGQLQLVGEQPVPIDAFHNSDLTNGAVVNPHDIPDDILDAVYQGVGNHPLLNPSLYRSNRKRRHLLDTNEENTRLDKSVNMKDTTETSDNKREARTIIDGSRIKQESPVLHFIMPQVNDEYQSTLKSYLQSKLEEQNASNQNSNIPIKIRDHIRTTPNLIMPQVNDEYQSTLKSYLQSKLEEQNASNQNSNIPIKIRDHIRPTPNSLSNYRNANLPNVDYFGGVGSDKQEITAGHSYRPKNNINIQSSLITPRSSSIRSIPPNIPPVLGGVGNPNNSNLPLGVGTSLNTNDLTYLQVLSQLANKIKSTENKNIDINALLDAQKNPSQRNNSPQFYSAGNLGLSNSNINQYFSTTTSAPVENRGSILELLPSNLPHVNPLVSQQLGPSLTPVNLAAVLASLPSPATLQQEQLKVHLATITGTNTFAGHAGNQGLLNNNQYAAQNSANGNYGQFPSFDKVTSSSNGHSGNTNNPSILNDNRPNYLPANKQTNQLLLTLLASQLKKTSSQQTHPALNNFPSSALTPQTNNPHTFSSNSFSSHSLLNRPSVNHQISLQNPNINQFNSQRNPSSQNLSTNNPALNQLLSYLSKIRGQSHINNQNLRPSNLLLQRPSAISGIAQPPSSPFSQSSQSSSFTNPLSLLDHISQNNQNLRPSNLLLQRPSAISGIAQPSSFPFRQTSSFTNPLAHISQLESDTSPSSSIDLSSLVRPDLRDVANAPTNTVPRTVTTTNVQDCLKETFCALGLAALISLAITKTLAIPFIAPAFFGRRRRNLDVISTIIENPDNFIENIDTYIEGSDRNEIIEMMSTLITDKINNNSSSVYFRTETIDHKNLSEKVDLINKLTINDIRNLILHTLNFINSNNLIDKQRVIKYENLTNQKTFNTSYIHAFTDPKMIM